jgi:signal transduction histidine kinase
MDQPLLDRLAGWVRAHSFAVDLVSTGTAMLFLALLPYRSRGVGDELMVSLLLLAPLAWRRRNPVAAAAVVVVAGLFELAVINTFLPANVAALVMVYALAVYAPRWASRAGLAVGLVSSALAALRYFTSAFDPYTSGTSVDTLLQTVLFSVAIAVTVVAAWALGDLRRTRMQQLSGLQERARLLELERDQEMRLAASTERARIAREMHDVVAHSLSVVIAQADGGRYAAEADPPAATRALDQISATGRQALTDMRALLGVLREDGGQEYAPQPDIAAIKQLVTDVQASGLDVDLIVEGSPVPMPAGPQLAAYRIVQESLTNVLKHAGPASRAWVRLQWRTDALEVAVLDDGRGAAAAVAEADGPVPAGSGHGLLGMRERAELHGGRLTAAPRHGGGFGVHAVLPYRSPR